MKTKPMTVPADLRERLAEEACAMGVPVEWVLRAAIEVALRRDDDAMNDLCIAVEAEARKPRIVRMPKARHAR